MPRKRTTSTKVQAVFRYLDGYRLKHGYKLVKRKRRKSARKKKR